MIKKIVLSILFTFFILPGSLYANSNISSVASNWFSKFSQKINYKYSDAQEIIYFKSFSTKLNDLLAVRKFNESQIKLVEDLIILSNERVFKIERINEEYETKKNLQNNYLIKDFKYISYNSESIFLENGIWYTYKFDQHLTFPKGTNIKKEDLDYNGIKSSSSLVFLRNDNALGFVNNYEKIKLISNDIILGIPDKYNFLKEIKNDKKTVYSDTDTQFEKLKIITKKLTNGKKESEKIRIIYEYILENIEYPINYSLKDPSIFSGIDTLSKKSGICEGYTKIFLYMLSFAGINDIEVIRGYVIDALDFPNVGHAWVKIGNNYYDPTFDDPIGQTKTKKYSEYKYYNIPKDLFYTNRYDFDKLPSYLKIKNSDYIKSHIVNKIFPLINKYKKSGYNILKPYILRFDNGIELDKKLDINDLIKIMEEYEVNNFKFIKNGVSQNIKNLKYFKILDSNVETIIEQINYSFNGKYLFKWILDDGSYEYRLGYNVEIK